MKHIRKMAIIIGGNQVNKSDDLVKSLKEVLNLDGITILNIGKGGIKHIIIVMEQFVDDKVKEIYFKEIDLVEIDYQYSSCLEYSKRFKNDDINDYIKTLELD